MNWTPKDYQMTCASYEAAQRVYKKVNGKSGSTWLVPIDEHAADGVHVDMHKPNSEGYAGRTLTFKLDNGSTYDAKGPWHSNCDALFSDTGIDLRNGHFTFVVLAKDVTFENHQRILTDVVYIDEKPTKGSFDRYKELAKQFPEAKYYHSESKGGSSSGPL